MSRRNAREAAMRLLYQYSITGELEVPGEEEAELLRLEKLDDEDVKYLNHIAETFLKKQEEIDGLISAHSDAWKIERIGKVDLAVLRLAIFEMRYMDVPPKVSVNEAVELAKKYGTDKSYKYVNGLLGGYLRAQQQ